MNLFQGFNAFLLFKVLGRIFHGSQAIRNGLPSDFQLFRFYETLKAAFNIKRQLPVQNIDIYNLRTWYNTLVLYIMHAH